MKSRFKILNDAAIGFCIQKLGVHCKLLKVGKWGLGDSNDVCLALMEEGKRRL